MIDGYMCMHACMYVCVHVCVCDTNECTIFNRYILIDWLLEVAVMKDFPPATVHLAVGLFDRYILRRKLEKNKIQLLGITAFLVASRCVCVSSKYSCDPQHLHV